MDPGPTLLIDLLDGSKRRKDIINDVCVECGEEAKEFRDETSINEYRISGLCQHCQDHTFS